MSATERLITVNDRRFYLRTHGAEYPTVVFDAGHGDGADGWGTLIEEVAAFAQTYVYDRAGIGRSEAAPPPRTSGQIVEDLRALLAAAAIPPPYLLVGHSLGGLNMQLYARRYPRDVAGLILLDTTHADFPIRVRAALSPEECRAFDESFGNNPEGIDRQGCWAEVRAAAPMPDIPLVVIARGQAPPAATLPANWPTERMEQIWQGVQKELAGTSPQGRFMRAERSGHYVHHDQPALILAEIRRVVASVRGADPGTTAPPH